MKKVFTLLALALAFVMNSSAQVSYSHWVTESSEGSKPKDNTTFNFEDGSKWDFGIKAAGTANNNAGEEGEKTFSKYTSDFTLTVSGTKIEGTITKITFYGYYGGTPKTGDDITIKVGTSTFGTQSLCAKNGTGVGNLTNATVITGSQAITKTDNITFDFASNDFGKGIYVAGIKIEYTLPAGSVLPPTITESTEKVGAITVTMTAEEGATIKYKMNGGNAQTYSSALTVDSYAEVTAWAEKGGKNSSEVSATYIVMPDLTNGKVWNFARVLDSDWENLAADEENWAVEKNTDDNTVLRYNNKNAIEGILIANKQVLKATEGLKFNVSTADRIRINKALNKLQINGSNLPIIIPNLKAGQYVTVIGESAKSSATDRYLATTTNIEVITGFANPNATDFTSIGKVVADGSIEMTTTAGINIFSIEISNSLPTVSVTVPEDGYCTFTPSVPVNFGQSNIAAYKASISGEDITFTEVSEVAKGEGVMLFYEGGLTDDVPVCSKSAPDSDNEFVGVLTEIASLPSDDGTYANYILNNGSEGMGFYKANNKKVAAGKAYLRVSSSAAGAKNFFSFSFMESGGTTGINEVQNTKNNGELYNLNGMRLSKPTQKGIYIMNGKKFIVK